MGDYAEMEIERQIYGRYPDSLDGEHTRQKNPKSQPTHKCNECGKWCRGERGLEQNTRDKHRQSANQECALGDAAMEMGCGDYFEMTGDVPGFK